MGAPQRKKAEIVRVVRKIKPKDIKPEHLPDAGETLTNYDQYEQALEWKRKALAGEALAEALRGFLSAEWGIKRHHALESALREWETKTEACHQDL